MSALKRIEAGQVPEKPKRRKVVGFAVDMGIEATECVSLHLVSSAEEMQDISRLEDQGLTFHPEFLTPFVGEDGKIFGYKGLKIDVWLNALSFHAYVDIQFESKVDEAAKSGKGTTDLTDLMKRIFGAGLVGDRDVFIQSLSGNEEYIEDVIFKEGEVIETREISAGNPLSCNGSSATSKILVSYEEIIRLEFNNTKIREWYKRLVPLVLLFVEGSQPIEEEDPRWEIFITIQKETLNGRDTRCRLLGFSTVYRFFRYPDTTRLRISQILVLPPYQGKCYGLHLLEAVNRIAVQRNSYDVTVEEPSQSLQDLRDCMDTLRLISFEPVLPAVVSVVEKLKQGKLSDNNMIDCFLERSGRKGSLSTTGKKRKERSWWLPSSDLVEGVRKHLKISQKQFRRCWEVLVFLKLDPLETQSQENYQICLMEQIMSELFGKSDENIANGKCVIDTENKYDNSKTFIMFRSNLRNSDSNKFCSLDATDDADMGSQEDQLRLVLEERHEEIAHVAEKVSSLCKSLAIPIP